MEEIEWISLELSDKEKEWIECMKQTEQDFWKYSSMVLPIPKKYFDHDNKFCTFNKNNR